MTASMPTFPPAATGLPGRPPTASGSRALAVGAFLALGLAGCCLEADGHQNTCLEVAPAPLDAGPLIVFEPNPSGADSGVRIASAVGAQAEGRYQLRVFGQDGGFMTEMTFDLGPDDYLDPNFVLGTGSGSLSWSADAEGQFLNAQRLFDAEGRQVCAALGEPCGSHGSCCVGLSCQAVASGCACEYAWPDQR